MTVPRWAVGAVLLWICGITAATGLGFQRQNDQANDLRTERCESGRRTREDQEALLSGLALSLGGRPSVVDAVHAYYDDLPPLPDC